MTTKQDNKTIKIKMLKNHQNYQSGVIYDLDASLAIKLLTLGLALKIHRKEPTQNQEEVIEDKKVKSAKSKK